MMIFAKVLNSTMKSERPSRKKVQRIEMIHKEIDTNTTYIQLIGRLDILGVEEVEQGFNEAAAGKMKSVIVDLSGLELLNSIGLGMFISNANKLRILGKQMILLKPKPRIEKVIRMAQIDELLSIEQDLDAALKLLNAT